jgi:hypothetical protein
LPRPRRSPATSPRITPSTPSCTWRWPTSRPSKPPTEPEGLLDRTGCLHVGIRGPLYTDADLTEDSELGFQVVPAPDVEHLGVAGMVERIQQRVGDRPVYVSVDIDVLDPAHAPGTGTPEAERAWRYDPPPLTSGSYLTLRSLLTTSLTIFSRSWTNAAIAGDAATTVASWLSRATQAARVLR